MKKILLVFVVSLLLLSANAQVSINTTGNNPDPSAGLDVNFTNKGLLIPQVALTGANDAATIPTPATSLLIYNTATVASLTPGYYYNSGTTATPVWTKLGTANHYIGEQFGGGVIFHLFKDTAGVEHGLIMALTQTTSMWSNIASLTAGTSSWDGLSNSNAIVSQSGHTSSAAKWCLDLVSNGQSDWYLPSADELNLLLRNYYTVSRSLSTIPGATQLVYFSSTQYYWSSSDVEGAESTTVHVLLPVPGYISSQPKGSGPYRVCAIRAF